MKGKKSDKKGSKKYQKPSMRKHGRLEKFVFAMPASSEMID